ncbi:serine protease [Prosthecobacter sp. SYSU 5D2]|uniref:S1 family peptidase n=1 Tax=Prosthecobacter sp. SYSU 5D2 TaxID=3134134 RepID=UPI0031FE5F81
MLKYLRKYSIATGIFAACAFMVPSAPADDGQLGRLEVQDFMGKKVYENARVIGPTDKGLKVVHDAGISIIAFKNLPPHILAKYPQTEAPKMEDLKPAPVPPTTAAKPEGTQVNPGVPGAAVSSFDPNCLVLIRTDGGAGSGFIASTGGKSYVYTNAHVLCGTPGSFTKKIVSIKTASGRTLPLPPELELSDSYDANSPGGLEDIARFPVTLLEGETAYEIKPFDVTGSMNRNVVAYGNSAGMDVVTSLKGQILGLGTDRIEISCEIVGGNSGGPVVLEDAKQVIGISTYLSAKGTRDIWSKNTVFDGVRRFAVRPEQVTKWRKMSLGALLHGLSELEAFDRDTLTLAAACYLNPRPNRGGFDMPTLSRGDFVVKQIIIDGGRHPLGATISNGIARVNQRLGASSSTISMQGVVPVFSEFFSSVTQKSNAQITSIQMSDRAPYVRQFFAELIETRKAVHAQFVQEGLTRFR